MSFNIYFLGIVDKVRLCVRYADTRTHTYTHTQVCAHTHTKSPLWWDPAHVLLLVREHYFLCEVTVAAGGDWPVRALWFCRLSRMLLASSLTSLWVCGCV